MYMLKYNTCQVFQQPLLPLPSDLASKLVNYDAIEPGVLTASDGAWG